MNITFSIHHNPEHAIDAVLDATLTLVLVSPDFFAATTTTCTRLWHLYLDVRSRLFLFCSGLQNGETNTVIIPRNSDQSLGNNAAWSEVSKEIRKVIEGQLSVRRLYRSAQWQLLLRDMSCRRGSVFEKRSPLIIISYVRSYLPLIFLTSFGAPAPTAFGWRPFPAQVSLVQYPDGS